MDSSKDYIPEKRLDKYPSSVSHEKMQIINEQMEKCICKIECCNVGTGTGFFCKIPFPDELNLLPVLITNNHVLEENDITPGKKIKFSLNKNKYSFEILMDDIRRTYTNKDYDITIIEIKKNDNLNNY